MATLKNNQLLLTFLVPILLTTPHYTMATTIASLCLKHYPHTNEDSHKKETSLFKKYSSLQKQRTGFNSLYLLTEFLNEELLHVENDYHVIKSRIQLYGSDEHLKMAISKAQSTTENILKKIPFLKKEITETKDKTISEELNSTISKCHEDLKLCRAALSLSLRESNEFFKFIDPLLEATERQKNELKNLQKNLLQQTTNSPEESDPSSQIIEQRILRISSLQKVILNFKTELSQSIDTAVSLKDMTLPQLESLLRSLKSDETEVSLTSISKLTKSFEPPKDRSAESLEFLTEPGKEFLSFLEKYNNSSFSPALSEKFRQIFLKDTKNNELQRLSLADAKKILTLVTNSNISLTESSAKHFSYEYSGFVFYAINNNPNSGFSRLITKVGLDYRKDIDSFESYLHTSVVPQINFTIENILLLFKLLDVTYTSSQHPIAEQYFAFVHELLSEQKNQLENSIKQKKTISSKLKNLFTSTDETNKKTQLKIVFIDTLITHLETLKKFHLDHIQWALNRHQIPLFTIENTGETIPASVNDKAMEAANEKP